LEKIKCDSKFGNAKSKNVYLRPVLKKRGSKN
jgi:hypothetical protein